MSAIADAAASLRAAAATVEGVRVYIDPGASLDPPAALVGPPRLEWQAYCDGPTSGRFLVIVAVKPDDRAMERLWELVPLVAAALETVPDVTVIRADPGVWTSGGTDLPSYEITTEVSL